MFDHENIFTNEEVSLIEQENNLMNVLNVIIYCP